MDKDKTVKEQDEKTKEEVDTSQEETTVDETTENTDEQPDKDKEVVEKEEEVDPYEVKLKEMEEKLELEKTMNRQKSGALKGTRNSIKALEDKISQLEKKIAGEDDWEEDDKPSTPKVDTSNFADKDEIAKLQKQIETQKELASIAPRITSVAEEKLINIYIDKGYSVQDAYLKANEHLIDKVKADIKKRIDSENQMLKMSGTQNYSNSKEPAYNTDKKKKEVASFLDELGASEAKKFID